MAEFVEQALRDELHPKIEIKESKDMGNMRTMAFQVPEELFQKIKDYLQRNHMTQKQFVIGLIETEIERDLTQRAAQKNTAVSRDLSESSDEVGESAEEQVNSDFEDVSDGESNESENEDLDDEQDESEGEELDEDEAEDQSEDADESEVHGMAMSM